MKYARAVGRRLHALSVACLCLTAQGCGLILDLTPPEDWSSDAGRDAAALDGAAPDISDPCSDVTATIPLAALDDGGTLAPSYSTPCTTISVGVTGAPSGMTPRVTGASDPPHDPVIHLIAEGGMSASLVIGFGRPVRDLSFVFEWLSLNPAESFDERLRVHVDGAVITPSLRWQTNVVVEAGEVRSTARKGDGQVDVGPATELGIELRNADVGDGIGIELHSFTYTIDG